MNTLTFRLRLQKAGAVLAVFLWACAPSVGAQTVSFLVPPQHTPVQSVGVPDASAVGLGAVISGSSAVSYVWKKSTVVVGSGTAVAANDWKSVAAGASHTLALRNDGSLWGWGSNQSGQLASVSAPGNEVWNAPVRIGAQNDWISVFARGDRSGAIKSDGTAWYWGGSSADATMKKVGGDRYWESGVFGGANSLYLLSLGGIYVFRPDMEGEPSVIGNARDWAALSASGEVLVALKRDGTLWTYNAMAAVTAQASANGGFYQVKSGRWKAACAGAGYGVALRSDGTLWAWKTGATGGYWSLFENGMQTEYVPRQLGSRSDWKSIAADVLPLAVDAAGRVHCVAETWSVPVQDIPVSCRGVIGRVTDYSKWISEGLALGADGTLWAWGANDRGQLGDLQEPSYYPGSSGSGSSAVQVGVHGGWGLDSPVLGVPLGLVVTDFQTADLGLYELLVNNVAAGTLAVGRWTTQPENRRLPVGASLQLTASGSLGVGAVPTYQWYRNGSPVSGQTSSTLTVASAQIANAGVYWLEMARGGVVARSQSAAVVVEESNLVNVHSQLLAKNHSAAATSLANMLAGDASHPAANVLKAANDLYLFSKENSTVQMFAALGFVGSADPLNFTLKHTGYPAGGALTADTRKWMREVLYPKLVEADRLLGNVTSTGFVSALLPSDFGQSAGDPVPFDYGDVQLARAGLNVVMSLLKWVETQNTDVSLLALKNKRDSGALSLESLLAMYPDLLKASATANEAQTEFVDRFGKAISYYLKFSAFANPTPGATGAKRQDPEQAVFTLTTAEDRESERRLKLDCERLQASLAATSAVGGLQSFSLPTSGFEGTRSVQASPWVFFKHAPGWRGELPVFKANAYVPGSLRADTAVAFFPALELREVGRFEAGLAAAEPGLAKWLKTGRETVPPTVQLLTLSSGTASATLQNGASLANNGWLTVSGTVADVTGVGRVLVTRTTGGDVASAVANLVERVPAAGAVTRIFDWSAQLPAAVGAGTIAASAWDFSGNAATTSASVNLTAASSSALPVVPEQAREILLDSPVAMATVVPSAGTVQFTWRRNGNIVGSSGTSVAVDDWAAVSVGGEHTAAIKRDGTLWSWGSNSASQLGTGGGRQFPEKVGNGTNWASVYCGRNFTVALTRSGSLWASGSSPFGTFQQLSAVTNPTATSQTWARVSCADSHALALTRGGRLFVWSDGSATSVDSGSDWAEIAAGNGRGARLNFAVKRDGTLWAWGDNMNGHLGLGWGDYGPISFPVQVGGDKDWMTVATCATNTWNNVLSAAVKKDGTLWAWGFAPDLFPGQTWNMYGWGAQMTPRRVGPQDARWAAVSVAEYSVLGTRPDGKLFEIGDDWLSARALPTSVVATAANGYSYAAVGSDGVLWMWGLNHSGQVGNYTPRDMANAWQDWGQTYVSDPVQVGVHPDWGLSSPVRGIPIPLGLESVSSSDLGVYNLTVTRGASSATSLVSLYRLAQPGPTPVFTSVNGGSFSLSGLVNAGASVVSYQWYRNGVAVSGGTTAEILVAPTAANAGVYSVQAVTGKAVIRGVAVPVVVDSAYTAQAREALRVRDYAGASAKLSLALAANPNDGPALFLRSALDIYNLWSDPSLAANLAALGISGSPDPLNMTLRWSPAGFPKGALSAPLRAWLLGTLHPKLVAAEANLAKITDTGFITAFSAPEFGLEGDRSVVDYGDVQLLRGLVNLVLAAVKWIETQNTDVDLAALQLDRQNGRLSVESLLAKYPSLLAASGTAPAAQAEFVSRFKQALERYKAFSDCVNPTSSPVPGQRLDSGIGTARLETSEDRTSERDFREAINKTLESINAADALAGRRTVQISNGTILTASPHAFVQHAPGWRSELPKFSRNAMQRNTLNRTLLQAFYPAFTLEEIADLEEGLVKAEPGLTNLLGTRDDATPPSVTLAPVTALSSYDGWVNLEGTVQDAVGVRRVTVTVGSGDAAEVFEAELEEQRPAADGTRLYKWNAALPLFGQGVGSLAFSVSAEDVFGGVVESPIVKVLPVERMVPLTVGSRGGGDLTFTVTPPADENGFVRVGSKLTLVARPKAGNLLRRIETVVDGETLPQSAYRSSGMTLTIRGETAVSAVFEPNPYLLVGGRNRMAGGILRYGWGDEYSREGVIPISALQLSLSPTGSFSGRLRMGLSSYAIAGRFDADGFYSVRLPYQLISLGWSDNWKRPVQTPLNVQLKIWVDTSNGPESPFLRAEAAGDYGGKGILTPLAARDYFGQPTFTGYLAGGEQIPSDSSNGVSESARALWNRAPGWWSVIARKSGVATLTGVVPGRGRFTASGYLSNQDTLAYNPGAGVTASGEYADVQILTSVNADTALRWISTLYTPAAGYGFAGPNSGPSVSGSVRTEMWYPGNRGPVFESSAPSAVGTNAYTAFASVGTIAGVGFSPAAPGQTLAPFVTASPGMNMPRKLAVVFMPGAMSGMDPNATVKGFELQATTRNTVGVVPGSTVGSFSAAMLGLNPSTGILSGSVVLPAGKRTVLQGVLLQRTFGGSFTPSGFQNTNGVYGVGTASDGMPFVLSEVMP